MSNRTLRRLKVATELRNLSETNSPVMCFDKVDRYAMGFQALKAVIGKGDLFENLADLIEPDTCVMSFVEEESMVATWSHPRSAVIRSRSAPIAARKSGWSMTVKTRQGNMVSLISVVKGLLRQKVAMGMMLDILIGTAAINRALDTAEVRAND